MNMNPDRYPEHVSMILLSQRDRGGFCFLFILLVTGLFFLVISPQQGHSQAFSNAKYGSDFLQAGVGARALSMGGSQTAISQDASSIFWNPAGLMLLRHPDLLLMHSERFAGTVAYDFAGIAIPLHNDPSSIPAAVVGFGFIRQGVDGIQNTLNAWDPERNRPREDAASFIEEFNVSDLAMYLSYAQPLIRYHEKSGNIHGELMAGASLKVIHHRLGPFANAWGYGLDVGLQARKSNWLLGVQITDLLPMIKFWTVDEKELAALASDYGDVIPSGKNEKVLPAVRIGAARKIALSDLSLLLSSDLQFRAENRQAYFLNAGRVSMEPHFGVEGSYKEIVTIRIGLTDLIQPDGERISMTPAVGTGFRLGNLRVDYGFTDFTGYASDLGVTHRISVGYEFR